MRHGVFRCVLPVCSSSFLWQSPGARLLRRRLPPESQGRRFGSQSACELHVRLVKQGRARKKGWWRFCQNMMEVKIQAGNMFDAFWKRGLTMEKAPNQVQQRECRSLLRIVSAASHQYPWNILEPRGRLVHAIHRSLRWWGHLDTFRTSFPSRFLDSRLLIFLTLTNSSNEVSLNQNVACSVVYLGRLSSSVHWIWGRSYTTPDAHGHFKDVTQKVCRQATRASSPITDTRAMELHEETCIVIPQMLNYPCVAQWKSWSKMVRNMDTRNRSKFRNLGIHREEPCHMNFVHVWMTIFFHIFIYIHVNIKICIYMQI